MASVIDRFRELILGREPIDVISNIPQRQLTPRVRATLPQARQAIQEAQRLSRLATLPNVFKSRIQTSLTKVQENQLAPFTRVSERLALGQRPEREDVERLGQEVIGFAPIGAGIKPIKRVVKSLKPLVKKISKLDLSRDLLPELEAIARRTKDFGPASRIFNDAQGAIDAIQQFGDKVNPVIIKEAREVIKLANKQLKRTEIRPLTGKFVTTKVRDFDTQAGFISPEAFVPKSIQRGVQRLIAKVSPGPLFKSLKPLRVSVGGKEVSQLVPRKIPPVKQALLSGKPQKITKEIPTRPLVGQEKLTLEANTNLISSPEVRPLRDVLTIDKNITPKQKVNIIDFLRTPTTVLKKMGLGKQGEALEQAWTNYKVELPDHLNNITGWLDRLGSKESSTRVFRALDGQSINLSPIESQVTNEVRGYLAEWATRLGLPKEKRVADYITRLFEDQFITKEFDPDLAKAISGKVAGSVYNPFLQKRLGKLGYREDLGAALQAYVKRATRKVHMDPPLAALKKQEKGLELSQSNYVAKLTDRVNMRPTEIDQSIDNAIRAAIGNRLGVRPTNRLSTMFRMMTFRGTLGLNVGSAVRNLTQGVNTFAKLGTRWTTKGYVDVMKHMANKDFDELIKNGVLEDTFIDVQASVFKRKLHKVDQGLFFFFEKAEQINRGAAFYGGKAKALAQGKSLKQAVKEGVDLARVTQFKFGPTQTPPLLQSDINKFLLQFQSFNIKQAEFLADMVVNKEWLALGRYMVGAAVVTGTIGKLIGIDAEDWIPFLDDALEGETRIGKTPTIQLATTAAKAAVGAPGKFGQPVTGGDVAQAGIPFIPGGTQIKKTIKGLRALQVGGSTSKSGRIRFPVTDPKSVIFGEFQNEIARFYFDNELTPLGEKDTKTFKDRVKAGDDPNQVFFDLTVQRMGRSKRPPEQKRELLQDLRDLLGIQDVSAAQLGPTPEGAFETAKQEKEKFKKITELLNSDLPQEEKDAQIKGFGISQQDLEYFDVARLDSSLRTAFVEDLMNEGGTIDELAQLRRKVGGKRVLSTTVIDNLFKKDLITTEEKKLLKSIEFDKDGQLKVTTKIKKGKKPKKLPKIRAPRAQRIRAVTRKPAKIKRVKVPQLPKITSKNRVQLIAKSTTVEEFKRALLKAR